MMCVRAGKSEGEIAWRLPVTSLMPVLALEPCPKWNTSYALAVLWTYNGRRVHVR